MVCICTKSGKVQQATDTSGYFIFNVKEAGTYTITASKESFSRSISVEINQGNYIYHAKITTYPLIGELQVGNVVKYDNIDFRVLANRNATQWYLGLEFYEKNIIFFKSNPVSYGNSNLLDECGIFYSSMSELGKHFIVDTTVYGITSKAFAPSVEMIQAEFDYYAAKESNRIFYDRNGQAQTWWTAYTYNSGNGVDRINPDGKRFGVGSGASTGFRPHICIDTSIPI